MKEITLGLAEKTALNRLIEQSKQTGTLEAARNVRSLRRDLGLRTAQKQVARMQQRAQELGQEIGQCEDKDAQAAMIGELQTTVPSWNNLLDSEIKQAHTIESGALSWLSGILEKHDWGEITTEQGQPVRVATDPGMLEAVANLGDAVAAALTGA